MFISGLSCFIYLHLSIHTHFIICNFHLVGGTAIARYNFFIQFGNPYINRAFFKSVLLLFET